MNKEIKGKIEQAAKEYFGYDPKGDGEMQPEIDAWFDGVETILDNYHDYGLQSMEKYKDMVSANVRLGAENQRLREALEKI